jgi:hypothetical protein
LSSAALQELAARLRLNARLQAKPVAITQPTLSSAQVFEEYSNSLARVAAAEAEAANPGSRTAAAAVARDFLSWLGPHSTARHVSPANCTPEDIVVFLESHWLHQHGSTLLSDGEVHAAPSYLSTSMSHLSGMFKVLGRVGVYDPDRQVWASVMCLLACLPVGVLCIPAHLPSSAHLLSFVLQVGNPCLSAPVNAFKATYTKQMWELGYAERSAKSLSFGSFDQLTRRLSEEGSSLLGRLASTSQLLVSERFSAAQPALLLQRDLTLMCLQWQSAVRGHNSCILKGEDLQDRRGSPLLPLLLQSPGFPFQPGFKWQFAPNGTKPRQQRRAGCLEMEVLPAADKHRDPLRHVHKLLQVTRVIFFLSMASQ